MAAPPAGALNNYVVFQTKTESRTTHGGFAESWSTAFSRWCRIRGRAGDEFFAADQTRANVTHMVTCRYDPAITTKHRISTGGRVLTIGAVLDRQGTKEKLELLCEEQAEGA